MHRIPVSIHAELTSAQLAWLAQALRQIGAHGVIVQKPHDASVPAMLDSLDAVDAATEPTYHSMADLLRERSVP